METPQKTGNMILDAGLLVIGVTTGVTGSAHNITAEDLEFADAILSLVLKSVSILSFLAVLVLNGSKILKMMKKWFKKKE